MGLKIQAFFIAVYLFFAGFIYGDQPIEIEIDCEFSSYEVSPGGTIDVKINCKNIGRPFEGEHNHGKVNVSFYKIDNGTKKHLRMLRFSTDEDPQPILIKNSEEFSCRDSMQFHLDAEPGVYSASVSAYGCEKIYEDVLTIK